MNWTMIITIGLLLCLFVVTMDIMTQEKDISVFCESKGLITRWPESLSCYNITEDKVIKMDAIKINGEFKFFENAK